MTPRSLSIHRIERDVVRPVLENQERPVERLGSFRRDLQHVDRFVEARARVQIRAEPHAERLDEGHEGVLRKVLRAVECHVLGEMGQPLLVVLFEHGPGLDDEAQFGALLGLLVGADVVAQAVLERALGDLGVDRDRVGERGCLDGARRGRLLGGRQPRRDRERRREQRHVEASANGHQGPFENHHVRSRQTGRLQPAVLFEVSRRLEGYAPVGEGVNTVFSLIHARGALGLSRTSRADNL